MNISPASQSSTASRLNLPAGSRRPEWKIVAGRLVWHLVWTMLFRPWPRRLGNAWRAWLLRLFGARIGRGGLLSPSMRVMQPWELVLGDFVAVGEGVHFYNFARVEVGSMSVISQDCYLCTGTHDYTDTRMPLVVRPIKVGGDVWLAAGVFVHPGVEIGSGAVIGAKSVVAKSMPPWMVCAGHPCRPIKERTLNS